MDRTFTDVWKAAAELSEEDRATLAGLLIESLEGEAETDVEAAWAAELERRVAGLDAGTVKSVRWEEVRQRLLDRLMNVEFHPGAVQEVGNVQAWFWTRQ